MDKDKLIKKLSNLAQLDIDASFAYEQALKNIDDDEIYKNIDSFRKDHIKHLDDLNKEIQHLGGEPLKRTKDFKGYIIEGFTSLRSVTGTEGALKAMESNEVLTNKTYKSALDDNDLEENIKKLLQKNYSDEQRHLDYIKSTIKTLTEAD